MSLIKNSCFLSIQVRIPTLFHFYVLTMVDNSFSLFPQIIELSCSIPQNQSSLHAVKRLKCNKYLVSKAYVKLANYLLMCG